MMDYILIIKNAVDEYENKGSNFTLFAIYFFISNSSFP